MDGGSQVDKKQQVDGPDESDRFREQRLRYTPVENRGKVAEGGVGGEHLIASTSWK